MRFLFAILAIIFALCAPVSAQTYYTEYHPGGYQQVGVWSGPLGIFGGPVVQRQQPHTVTRVVQSAPAPVTIVEAPAQSKWMFTTLPDGTQQAADTNTGNLFRWDRSEKAWLFAGNSFDPDSIEVYRLKRQMRQRPNGSVVVKEKAVYRPARECECGPDCDCVDCKCRK